MAYGPGGTLSACVRVEANLGEDVIAALRKAGHEIEVLDPFNGGAACRV